MLVSPWKSPPAAEALVRCSMGTATDRFAGVLFTGWNAGAGGGRMLGALRGEAEEGADGAGEAQVLKHCIDACLGGEFPESE